MKRWAEEITPLPPRTRSILRSTVILTSLVQVVSELIQNSLDANARSIQIGIDCDDWSCWVQDDGTGFTIDGLESLANNCKASSMRYSTSKVSSDGDRTSFGFRGEGESSPAPIAQDPELTYLPALASVADLSILEISSRTAKARQSWSVILKVRKRRSQFAAVSLPTTARPRMFYTSALPHAGTDNQPVLQSASGMHSTT